MKRIYFLSILFLLYCSISFSQKITSSDFKILREKEDSLKVLSAQIIGGSTAAIRLDADSSFTKMFVRALKITSSFYYPFDSLVSISRLAPPDSSFKIFTWQMNVNDEVTRQHGAIQINTKDGSLKLFPLIDKSDNTQNIIDTIGNNFGWIGAVYYQLIQKHASGKTYYTLLGYDENNLTSNKKIVEVLSFENGSPVFGGKYFSSINEIFANAGNRFILEYKKNAGPRLTYDDDLDMIIYEHLISETGEPQKKYTYIPDGDYEGLQWKNGIWSHIEKVFTQQLKDGEAPVPNPIRDENGNLNESLLKNEITEEENTTTSPGNNKPSAAKTKASGVKAKIKKK
ncbi:MAG: hypothetical protein ABIN97_16715 [Ginsengibacter sp.]